MAGSKCYLGNRIILKVTGLVYRMVQRQWPAPHGDIQVAAPIPAEGLITQSVIDVINRLVAPVMVGVDGIMIGYERALDICKLTVYLRKEKKAMSVSTFFFMKC